MTQPLVNKLMHIHQKNFRGASKKIKKSQRRYKRSYDKRNNVKPFSLKIGAKVQYRRSEAKSVLSKQKLYKWCPAKAFYLIAKVDKKKRRVQLINTKGRLLSKWQIFDNVRRAYC